jgi:DHA3 family macrolide efflux protein-like MFS transporter
MGSILLQDHKREKMTANIPQSKKRTTGFSGFALIWSGQLTSILASSITSFAITIWVFQQSGSVTDLGILSAAYMTPTILMTPIAGVLIDRYNRKLMMTISDLIAVLATVAVLVLVATGKLQIWHLFITNIFEGIGNAFQFPAYSAAISTMVPKEKYGQANGMLAMLQAAPNILAPMLAGALLPVIGLSGVLVIDVATFLIAIGTLLAVHIPQPKQTAAGEEASGSFWEEAVFGFRYLYRYPGLFGLVLVMFFLNLLMGVASMLYGPFVLVKTGNDTVVYGIVMSAGAVGMVSSSVMMSVWKGFKRRIAGAQLGLLLGSIAIIAGSFGRSLYAWIPAVFLALFFMPMISTSINAIYQVKVPPDIQGRVFSSRRLISWATTPITPLIAGALADYVVEPAIQTESWLSAAFGGLFGMEAGSGMAFLIFVCGAARLLVWLASVVVRPIREVEAEIPDFEEEVEPSV